MEITKQPIAGILEVTAVGRLDAYWADHLANALEEAVRDGAHHIRLNMAAVPYMSSVGIRVLLRFYKQLQRIHGSFAVADPSEAVQTVLELAGLERLLATATAPAAVDGRAESRVVDRETARFDVFETLPAATLRCRVVGTPELLVSSRFNAQHARAMKFPDSSFGVGLGAFGTGFDDCKGRFGEFLAVAGAAVYLPTDGSNVPDYVVSSKALTPDLNILYALVCDGSFARLARFESKPGHTVTLSEVADAALAISDADALGMVMIVESAGLIGAALRRSPAVAAEVEPFGFPQIREWLSFTPERAYSRSLAVIVGVAVRTEQALLAPLLRPLGNSAWPAGHFHAAAFSYRALQKGRVELQPMVAMLFEMERLQGVLHLLNDDRAIVGAGQSEFVRGACWMAPIAEIVAGAS